MRFVRRIFLLCLFLWPLWRVPCSRCQVVLNEILPDPEGSDAGREFVEIYNRSPRAVSLAGVGFQFANGADDPSWLTRWTGAAGDSLAAGGWFLLADHNWQGEAAPDAQCRLGLQNGPDAVRLVRGDTILDLVGYGPLTEGSFYEGNPASVAPGLALARRPDGSDTGDNAADFRLVAPTPGQANFLDYKLDLEAWRCEPPHADRPGRILNVHATLLNSGLRDLTAGHLLLECEARLDEAEVTDLVSGREVNLQWEITTAGFGRHPLTILCPLPETGDTLAVGLGALQVGGGGLVLNEVQPAPADGQGEWIEVANGTGQALDLESFSIRDEDGDWRPLPEHRLLSGQLVAVAQDSAALRGWIRDNADHHDPALFACGQGEALVLGCRSWPALNNAPPAGRAFADRFYLADSCGVVVDHLTLGPGCGSWDGVPIPDRGQSLERVASSAADSMVSHWIPCSLGSGGTPGCPNSFTAPPAPGPGLGVTSRILDRRAGPTSLGLSLMVPEQGTGFRMLIFDLWGQRVRLVGGDDLGPGLRIRYWTGDDDEGRPVSAGGYILVGEVTGPGGQIRSRERLVVGVR